MTRVPRPAERPSEAAQSAVAPDRCLACPATADFAAKTPLRWPWHPTPTRSRNPVYEIPPRPPTRAAKVPNWYLDLNLIIKYWEGASRVYHHTAPINMIYGLYQALRCLTGEGLEHVYARHRAAHEELVAGLHGLGLELLVEPSCRLPMLNAVKVPAGVNEAAVRQALLADHDIEIGAGLGPLAGKV